WVVSAVGTTKGKPAGRFCAPEVVAAAGRTGVSRLGPVPDVVGPVVAGATGPPGARKAWSVGAAGAAAAAALPKGPAARTFRVYHNLDPVAAVLDTVGGLLDLARDPVAVRLAAWFHDAVYDSRAGDNEERSAALAESRLTGWGVPPPTVAAVRRLILATKTHQ